VTTTAPNAVDVSLLVTTFRRPRHLALALESLALQRGAAGRFEVIVSDDGSGDETAALVRSFAAHAGIPTRFTTQPHQGFRLARVRNNAARLARGDYLLFLDGDCVVPRHHVATHLARRRPGLALVGGQLRLPAEASRLLVPENLALQAVAALVPAPERRRLARRHCKAWWQDVLRHPSKPRLVGCDFGVWRHDYEAVNGSDERFAGWGQEDDDLGLRLRGLGVRLASVLDRTRSLHVWHETDPTATRRWRDGANVPRLERRGRLTVCRAGVMPRPTSGIRWGVADGLSRDRLADAVARHLAGAVTVPPGCGCEIEVATTWGGGRFTRPAECRLLLAEQGRSIDPVVLASADQVAHVTDEASVVQALEDAG